MQPVSRQQGPENQSSACPSTPQRAEEHFSMNKLRLIARIWAKVQAVVAALGIKGQ